MLVGLCLSAVLFAKPDSDVISAETGMASGLPQGQLAAKNPVQQDHRYEQTVEQAQQVVAKALKDGDASVNLCWWQILAGQFSEARQACTKALARSPADWGAMVNLGHTWLLTGDADRARPFYVQALGYLPDYAALHSGPVADLERFIVQGWQPGASREARDWFLAEAPGYLNLLERRRKAAQWFHGGRYPEAIAEMRQVVAEQRSLLGSNNLQYTVSLNNLAVMLDGDLRSGEAEAFYRRSLAIRERVLGPDDYIVALALNNLAANLLAQNRYADAVPLLRRALVITESTYGGAHPDVALTLDNLAMAMADAGDYDAAEAMYRRALTIKESVYGPGSARVAVSLTGLAKVMDRTGQHDKAEDLYARADTISVRRAR
jgi:tetratricopeptide (TPR) repeat protein